MLEEIIRNEIRTAIKSELLALKEQLNQPKRAVEFLSIEEVLVITGMTKQGIFKRIRQGHLMAYKPGRRLVFKRNEVLDFVEKNKVQPKS